MYKMTNDRFGQIQYFDLITDFLMWADRIFGYFPEIAFEELNGDVYFEGPDGPELTLEIVE